MVGLLERQRQLPTPWVAVGTQSGSFVGGIYLDVRPDGHGGYAAKSLLVSQDALSALLGEDAPGTGDYWSSLPTCANAGPFLPNSLTVLQQLPGRVADAFRQSQ